MNGINSSMKDIFPSPRPPLDIPSFPPHGRATILEHTLAQTQRWPSSLFYDLKRAIRIQCTENTVKSMIMKKEKI